MVGETFGGQTAWVAQGPQNTADKTIFLRALQRVCASELGDDQLLAVDAVAIGIRPFAQCLVKIPVVVAFLVQDGC